MKRTSVNLIAVMSVIMGLTVFACGSSQSSSGYSAPSDNSAPSGSAAQSAPADNSASAGGAAQGASSNSEVNFTLPTSPDVPPSDVIEQIVFNTGGGPGPDCTSNCFGNLDQNTVSLSNFQPNQRLRVDVYKYNKNAQEIGSVYDFVTELAVQTDNNGSLKIHLGVFVPDFTFVVRDENGNVLYKRLN